MKRRNFIELFGASTVGIGMAVNRGISQDIPPAAPLKDGIEENEKNNILPSALKKGSKIAITAPASPTNEWEIRHSLKALKNLGFKIEIGDTIKKRQAKYKYLSAPDEERAAEFMKYVEREDVDCILCGRGGYGITRIMPMLDFEKIRQNSKIIIGFSDITALLNAIYTLTGLVTFHGPVAASTFDQFTINYFLKILSQNKVTKTEMASNTQISQNSITGNNKITIQYSTIQTINKGIASGRLVGGNLSMLASTLGTPYEIDTRGSILFFEEFEEHPYKIDRMLTQLWLAGKLQEANGIAIGYFKNPDSKRPYYPGGSFTIRQVLYDRFKPLGLPAIMGLPIGHVMNKLTLPIGINAELDATALKLTINEPTVA